MQTKLISMDSQNSNILIQISDLIISGNYKSISSVIEEALRTKITANEILSSGLLKGMEIVGIKFRDGLIFLPEVLMSAKAFKEAMKIIEPLLIQENSSDKIGNGKILLGTVKGDIHDIGKNLVGVMLKGNGFSVVDIGVDASIDKFVEAVEKENPDIIGLSAMLTTTMISMQKTVQILKEKFQTKLIIVGGAPVSQNFANKIGADGYGKNAIEAVELCKKLLRIN
ncbi:MAG: corrinoid protein [Ignavibacteria bacterium]|nr:corrinoid protein [Ignavibacteria bacterium]